MGPATHVETLLWKPCFPDRQCLEYANKLSDGSFTTKMRLHFGLF